MKKILQTSIFVLGIIIILSLYDITSIDSKYVNRSTISIDINNARNPQVKKILRTIDNYIGSIYFKLSKKKQQEFYFKDIDEYQNLPDEIIIQESTFSDLTISNNKNFNNLKNWKRSHGNHSSNKFSNLDQINVENVKNLEVAWIYEFDKNGDIPGNAIYFDKKNLSFINR